MRFETSPGRYRAMTALLLLGPWTPLLFQGEEFGATTPFVFFADVGDAKLRDAIRDGRLEFLSQFPSLASGEPRRNLPVPTDRKNFERCKLNLAERTEQSQFYDLHQDLIRLRREDGRFQKQVPGGVDGAVLGDNSFLLRFFGKPNEERLLLVNLGPEQSLMPSAEPLLAPPFGFEWEMIWSSDHQRYGGPGAVMPFSDENWSVPAEAAIALRAIPQTRPRRKPKDRSGAKAEE